MKSKKEFFNPLIWGSKDGKLHSTRRQTIIPSRGKNADARVNHYHWQVESFPQAGDIVNVAQKIGIDNGVKILKLSEQDFQDIFGMESWEYDVRRN